LKIAIVQDALVVSGGAERVAAALCLIFPEADFYTSVYLPDKTFAYFKNKHIYTHPGSFLVRNENQFKRLYPLWIIGFRLLDLSKYDLIISSSTYAAKFIRKPKNSIHICYLHSPFRLLWIRKSYEDSSIPFNGILVKIIDGLLPLFQHFDRKITKDIDQLITNSNNISKFIKEIYDCDSVVIHPPIVFDNYYANSKREEYFLFVGRLLSYKRVDLAIEACKRLKKKLIVVGIGPELENLQKISNELIEFKGNIDEENLYELYSKAKGLFFPGKEDFGLVPIEAQASGCPVIAYRAGGALETVVEGESGVFFDHQTVECVTNAIEQFESKNYDIEIIRKNAKRFDIAVFSERIKIACCWKNVQICN
jgi:glycosyltransferase involved in cell wall biosynthesis